MKKKTTPKRTIARKGSISGRRQSKKKIMLTTIAVGATGILGYFGWQYLRKRRANKTGGSREIDAILNNLDRPIVTMPEPPKIISRPKTVVRPRTVVEERSDAFPLQKGSRGENVRQLQEALMLKYGKSVLPKWGADGDFGSELAAALKKLGLPQTIDQSAFNVIAQGTVTDPATVGKDLYNATGAKDYTKVLFLLQKLKSVGDYSAASAVYKQNRVNGVRQTLVNGLLNTFSSEVQKQAIKFQFLRMGLQFDGSKWSLAGFDGKAIVTKTPTSVWLNATESVTVPARMVLGNEVSRRLDYTLFENGGQHYLVQTNTVQYL